MATHFRTGTVIVLNFRDGCGYLVGVITGESYKYSHSDGQEHTFFQVTPAPNQGLDEPFQITLDEAVRYGAALDAATMNLVPKLPDSFLVEAKMDRAILANYAQAHTARRGN